MSELLRDDILPDIEDEDQLKQEEITVSESPLSLDNQIKDSELVAVIEENIRASESYFNKKLNLKERRDRNERFWRGKHYSDDDIYDWELPFQDNIVYRNLETKIAIASGRMPDVMTFPSEDTPAKRENARKVKKQIEMTIDTAATKRLVKDGLRFHELYFTAAIKPRWNPGIGMLADSGQPIGEIEFSLVHPKKMGFDHAATIPQDGFTADNMDFVYEWIEEPLSLVLSKFPKKRAELLDELGIKRASGKSMNRKIRYLEIWFTWWDKDGRPVEGVCWKYKRLILDKMRNPNYDWEGYDQKVATGELDDDGLAEVEKVKKFRNHFDRPRKPYIFFTYQNLGGSPMDDTTAFEQALPLQETANKRGSQITEIADNAVGRLAFAGAFISKEEAEDVSSDPNEKLYFAGAEDVRSAVQVLQSPPPSPVLYNDLIATRGEIDSLFATHSTTRGDTVDSSSGRARQITREGDLTIADDIVTIMVDRIVSEMINWFVQLAKLRYSEVHYVRTQGADGESVFFEMTQDNIDDGLVVHTKANTLDKSTRRAQALELAKTKAIDPMTMMEDLDVPNPRERAKRLLGWMMGETDGFASYMKIIDVELVEDKNTAGSDDVRRDVEKLKQGEQPAARKVDESYLKGMIEFVNSDEFLDAPPQAQVAARQYVQKLRQDAQLLQQPQTDQVNA